MFTANDSDMLVTFNKKIMIQLFKQNFSHWNAIYLQYCYCKKKIRDVIILFSVLWKMHFNKCVSKCKCVCPNIVVGFAYYEKSKNVSSKNEGLKSTSVIVRKSNGDSHFLHFTRT